MSLPSEYCLKDYVVHVEEVVTYECLFSDVSALVDLILEDPHYRRMTISFHGLDHAQRVLCWIESIFEIDVRDMSHAEK